MGSYSSQGQRTAQEYLDSLQQEKERQPVGDSRNEVLLRMIRDVYLTEKIDPGPKLDRYQFVAARSNILFDLVDHPANINPDKLHMALTHDYSVEVIFLIPGKPITNNIKIKYRHVAEYVNLLRTRTDRSDLIRQVSEIRNDAEESHARRQKGRAR